MEPILAGDGEGDLGTTLERLEKLEWESNRSGAGVSLFGKTAMMKYESTGFFPDSVGMGIEAKGWSSLMGREGRWRLQIYPWGLSLCCSRYEDKEKPRVPVREARGLEIVSRKGFISSRGLARLPGS